MAAKWHRGQSTADEHTRQRPPVVISKLPDIAVLLQKRVDQLRKDTSGIVLAIWSTKVESTCSLVPCRGRRVTSCVNAMIDVGRGEKGWLLWKLLMAVKLHLMIEHCPELESRSTRTIYVCIHVYSYTCPDVTT